MQLFQPDNFSQFKINFKEYNGDLKPFLKILERYFNDFEIEKIYQVDRAEIQTQNYKIILSNFGKTRTLLLKKYKVLPDLEQTEFYLNFLVLLAEKDLLVSEVLKTTDGKLTVTIDGAMHSVFNFIEGDHFPPTEESFADVAMNMAKMHNAFNEFDEKYFSQIEKYSQKGYYPFNVIKNYSEEDLTLFEEKIKSKKQKENMEEVLLEKLPVFKNAVAEVEKYKERILNLPKRMIHSDFHPHNILMKDGKVSAIIDFENVRISQQARDIAFAIYKFGRQFFVNSDFNGGALPEASRLKDLFIDNYSKVKELSDEEIELLPILAKDTFVRKLLFVLKGVYNEGNDIWINDLPKHSVSIDEINYFWPD